MALPYLNLPSIEHLEERSVSEWISDNGFYGEEVASTIFPWIQEFLSGSKVVDSITSPCGIEFSISREGSEPQVYFDFHKSHASLRNALDELEVLRVYSQALNHDIKTPLQNIALQAELLALKGKEDPKVVSKCVTGIRESVFASQNIIEDLSNFAKLSKDTDEKCDVNEVIMHVRKLLHPMIDKKNAAIAHGAFADLKIQPYRMLIIMKNLIQNSIKYSGNKKPQILIYETHTKDKHVITVVDNGIGIPKKDQKNIFKPYTRASNVGQVQGTGIGLSTCKSLLRGAGAELVLESPVKGMGDNGGTAFHLEFPVSSVLPKR